MPGNGKLAIDPKDRIAPAKPAPKGLGGWLILPLLHFLVLPIAYPVLFAIGVASELKAGTGGESSGFDANTLSVLLQLSFEDWVQIVASDPASFKELAVGLGLMLPVFGLWVLSIFCLIQMLRKAAALPTLAIVYYAVALVFSVAFLAVSHSTLLEFTAAEQKDALKDAIRSFWGALIWINYFRLSKRVKNTFVN